MMATDTLLAYHPGSPGVEVRVMQPHELHVYPLDACNVEQRSLSAQHHCNWVNAQLSFLVVCRRTPGTAL